MKAWQLLMDRLRCGLASAFASTILLAPAQGQDPPGAALVALPAPGESEAPALKITHTNADLVVSWPASATNWVLEQAAQLQRPMQWWRLPPAAYASNGRERSVRVSQSSASRFFRLRQRGLPVAGLSGYWTFDEGEGPVAQGESDAIFLGNALWGAGRVGPGAVRFLGGPPNAGGSQAWVSNANYRLLPASGQPFSVSLWFNPEALPIGWQGLIGTDANGTNGWHVAVDTTGPGTNHLVFAGSGPGASLSVTGRVLLLPGRWRQLTATYDGTEGSLYLDRALLASGSGAVPMHEGPIYFGAGVGGYSGFAGRIDDVRFFTNALSAEQIALTGQWHFDENEGGFAADSSMYGHHAVTDPTAWRPGKAGSGVDVSRAAVILANDDYDLLPPLGRPFSVSLWVRPEALAEGQTGLLSCGEGTNDGWRLVVEKEGSGVTWLHWDSTDAGGTLDLRAPAAFTNGAWAKVDLTFNGGVATIYVNGAPLGSDSGAIWSSRSPLRLGAAPGLANFAGVIDEVMVFGRERGAAEIGPVARIMWETVFLNSATNLILQGFGPAGKPLTYSIVNSLQPTNGTIAHVPGSVVVTYQANNRKGPDAFAYTVSDGEFTSPPTLVALSVVEPRWLSPQGGPASPQDGRSPERAWPAGTAEAVDAIWRTNAYYDCFFYGPGDYETHGWKYFERSTANPGCKHIGGGLDGPTRTTIRLVDIWEPFGEERIFGPLHGGVAIDGFEVHNLVLDCNAAQLPKYERGIPVWLRVPLTATARVDTVTLRWGRTFLFGQPHWRTGPAAEFDVCALLRTSNGYLTNCQSLSSTGAVDVVPVNAVADEILIHLRRRASGVGFYGIEEIEVSGGTVSLPSATVPGGGPSQLSSGTSSYSIGNAVDGDAATVWASGPENEVQLVLPLAPGSTIDQIQLQWNCKTIEGVGRLGPAAECRVRARDPDTQEYVDVSFVREARSATGSQLLTLSAGPVVTDRVMIWLTAREAGVNYYSLREVSLQNGPRAVPLRVPTALQSAGGGSSMLQAFDRAPATLWASASQGAVGAVYATGSNLKFSRLKVIGFGTKAGRECFPFVATAPLFTSTAVGNILVEDCEFAEPAISNTDGLTTVTVTGAHVDGMSNAVVRRCTVKGVLPYFGYSHGFSALQVENCLVERCGEAVYSEPQVGVSPALPPMNIRSNTFVNVRHGVAAFCHAKAEFNSLLLQDNDIALISGGGWGFVSYDVVEPGLTTTLTNVTCLNNVVRYPDWVASPQSREGGFHYSNIRRALFGNNVIALGTTNALRVRRCPEGIIIPTAEPETCDNAGIGPPPDPPYPPPCLDDLQPGYRRAWFNNVNLGGVLLSVPYNYYGVERLARQQQWSE